MSAIPNRPRLSSRWLIAGSGKRLYQLATFPDLAATGTIVGLWSPHGDERCAAAERFAIPTADSVLDLVRSVRPDLVVASVLTDEVVQTAENGTTLALIGPLDWFDGARGLRSLLLAAGDARPIFIPALIKIAGIETGEGGIVISWHSSAGADQMSDLLGSGRAPFTLSSRAASVVSALLPLGGPQQVIDRSATAIRTTISPQRDRIELRGEIWRIGFEISIGAGANRLSTSRQDLAVPASAHRFTIDHPSFLVDVLDLLQQHSSEVGSPNHGIYASVALKILQEASR